MSESILQEAARIIDGKRTDDYGDPEDSFTAIAEVWNWYLNQGNVQLPGPLVAADVAHMMALLKLARVTTGHGTRDTYVDIAGYAALAGRIGGHEAESVPEELPTRIPENVKKVWVAQKEFLRSKMNPEKWFTWGDNTYLSDEQIYNYATDQQAEVEYVPSSHREVPFIPKDVTQVKVGDRYSYERGGTYPLHTWVGGSIGQSPVAYREVEVLNLANKLGVAIEYTKRTNEPQPQVS